MSDNTAMVAGNAATAAVGQSRSSAAFNGTVYWAWNFFGGLAILFAPVSYTHLTLPTNREV